MGSTGYRVTDNCMIAPSLPLFFSTHFEDIVRSVPDAEWVCDWMETPPYLQSLVEFIQEACEKVE